VCGKAYREVVVAVGVGRNSVWNDLENDEKKERQMS